MSELAKKQQVNSEQQAVDAAINDLDIMIAKHLKSARSTAVCAVTAFVILVLTGTLMNSQDTRMAIEVASQFSLAVERLNIKDEAISKSITAVSKPITGASDQIDVIDKIMDLKREIQNQLKPQIEAIVNHAKSAGVQYYNTLLLAGAGVFALVFGVLMTIYRHHLTEVSKCQHYKTAFTRVRVAMRSAENGERTALIQAALLDRAFEYRSGKEKQIESPVPGHPASEASTMLLNRLLELIEAPKRN